MKILSIDNQPIHELPFLNAGKRPGDFYTDRLPIHVATVDALPEGCEAIVATADLQGREFSPKNTTRQLQQGLRLLGEVLPEFLAAEIFPELGVNEAKTGAFLAGDFYTVPGLDKRGGRRAWVDDRPQ